MEKAGGGERGEWGEGGPKSLYIKDSMVDHPSPQSMYLLLINPESLAGQSLIGRTAVHNGLRFGKTGARALPCNSRSRWPKRRPAGRTDTNSGVLSDCDIESDRPVVLARLTQRNLSKYRDSGSGCGSQVATICYGHQRR